MSAFATVEIDTGNRTVTIVGGGPQGPGGDSAYLYVAWASDASGTDFTTTFNASLNYIAFKNSSTVIASPQASDFTGLWKNYKGATGANGDLAWHGDWAGDHGTYYVNDFVYHAVVGYGKGLFRCIVEHDPSVAATEPVTGGSAATYWETSIGGGQNGTGEVIGPVSTTENKIPQWDAAAKTLKDGLELATTVANPGVDTKIPTEQAVREAIADLMVDGVYVQALVNGGFQINQLAVATYTSATTPANSDDTYLFDQWILLSDGNDIADVSQETSVVPTGGAASAKFEVETQNKKFGLIQIIENKEAIKYAGKVASLQFKARTVTGKVIENVRAAVISWSSTADAVTSDVVSAWENEGTNPTLAANWTYENTATNNALVADAWTTYKIENISIDTASMANLAVFIWVDDTDASVDDLLYLADVQLNQGAVCLPYQPRSFDLELRSSQRFFQKSYVYSTALNANTIDSICTVCSRASASTSVNSVVVKFSVPMRTGCAPVITTYRGDGASAQWWYNGSYYDNTVIRNVGTGFHIGTNAASGLTTDHAVVVEGHWSADARL